MTEPGVCSVCGEELAPDAPACPRCGARRPSSPTVTFTKALETGSVEAAGEVFARRYRLLDTIGEGGQARVYRARDQVLEKIVALKVIAPRLRQEPEALARLRREIDLSQRVTHANVCRVYDLGDSAGTPFISMELIEGRTLAERLQEAGPLSPVHAAGIARQVCAGLGAIHAAGIVHRDLKPQNVMLAHSGRAVVMDLGIATDPMATPLTAPGSAMGTLAYISPEQGRGRAATPLSDVYSVGLVLFEMLTGRLPPGDGNPTPLSLRDPGYRPPPPSRFTREVPAALDDIVLKCLRVDPAERYGSADELAEALSAFEKAGVAAVEADRAPTRPNWITASWGSPAARMGVAPLLLMALALVVYFLLPDRAPTGKPSLALTALEYEGPEDNGYLEHFYPVVVERALRRAGVVELAPLDSSLGYSPGEAPGAIATSLGVDYLLRGRVRVQEERILLDVALFRREPRATIEQSYASPLNEPTGAADSVAGWLLSQLGLASGAVPQARSNEALRAYVEGKRLLEGWDVSRNPEQAADAFSRALVLDETFAEAHAGLARALWSRYRATGDSALVEQARAAAMRGVALGPSLPECHVALGIVLVGTGQSAEATAAFERARELAPADDAIARLIARAYAALGRGEEALGQYDRAIALRPGYWGNHNARGSFLARTGDLEGAERSFDEVIRLRPGSDMGYNNLAAVHLISGELEQAEPLLKAALRIQPGYRVHNNLGFVYYSTGRFAEAIAEFREASRLSPGRMEAHGNLGDALRQSGRRADAAQAYARAIGIGLERLAVDPTDAEARAGLAMYRAGAGDCGSAAADRGRAVAEGGQNPNVLYYAAVSAALCDRQDEAAQRLSEALALGAGADARTNPDLAVVLRRIEEAPSSDGAER